MIAEALVNKKGEMVCLSEAFTMILSKNQSKNWPAKDTNLTFNLQQTQHAYSSEDKSHINIVSFLTIWKIQTSACYSAYLLSTKFVGSLV